MNGKTQGWASVRQICCWAGGVLLIFVGGVLLVAPESWPNDRLFGGIIFLAGPLLLPPVLERMRAKMAWLRQPQVPAVLGCLIIPAALMISAPLTPTGQARDRLRDHALVKATQALRPGDAAGAQRLLRWFKSDHDQTVDRLLARAGAAAPAASPLPTPSASTSAPSGQVAVSTTPENPASAYVERISTYWLPEARSLPASLSDNEDAVGRLLSKIDGLVADIKDGDALSLSPAQLTARRELIETVSAKQRTLFPAMRKRYGEGLGAKLFRHDIRVTVSGPRSSVLRLTGGMFSLNANVEDMENELGPVVRPLRFTTVEYRWSRYIGETLSYRLHPPSDEGVGQWTGDRFEKIRKGKVRAAISDKGRRSRVNDPTCVPALAASVHLRC